MLTQCFNEQKEGAKDNAAANGKNEGEGGAEQAGSGGANEKAAIANGSLPSKGPGQDGGAAAACLSAADRRRVTHVLGSLVRIGGVAEALDKHRRRLEESIKLVVRIAVQEYVYSAGGEVPGAGGISGGDDNAKLGARLCSLDAGSFRARNIHNFVESHEYSTELSLKLNRHRQFAIKLLPNLNSVAELLHLTP